MLEISDIRSDSLNISQRHLQPTDQKSHITERRDTLANALATRVAIPTRVATSIAILSRNSMEVMEGHDFILGNANAFPIFLTGSLKIDR